MNAAGFSKSYWTEVRPALFFISGVSGWVGLSIPVNLPAEKFFAAFVAFFLSHGFASALVEADRPLKRAVVASKRFYWVSVIGLLGCAIAWAFCNPWTIPASGLVLAGLGAYSTVRRHWWSGPAWISAIAALLPFVGYLCGEPEAINAFHSRLLHLAMVSVFGSYAVLVVLGYFKQLSADRATGDETLPVAFGWRPAIFVSGIFAIGGSAASALLFIAASAQISSLASSWAALLWLAGVVSVIFAHVRMFQVNREDSSRDPAAFSARGFVLMHLGEVAVLAPRQIPFVIAYYLVFEWMLARSFLFAAKARA